MFSVNLDNHSVLILIVWLEMIATAGGQRI